MDASTIPDKNFWFALLDEVRGQALGREEWIESLRPEYETQAEEADWPAWEELEEFIEESGEPAPGIESIVLKQSFDKHHLTEIKRLTLDGDRTIYNYLGPDGWWDEEGFFAIKNLQGIEHFSALNYLQLGQGLVTDSSLSFLSALSNLRELELCALSNFKDIESVLDIPNLEKLKVANVETSDSKVMWESVLERFDEAKKG